jgi:hypothetical protein
MRKTTKVLALGEEEWSSVLRQGLLHWQRKGFVDVNNFWHLCALPQPVQVDVAVFHHSFPQDDLRYASEYVRRRWPEAAILVTGEQARRLDDPLYDDKIAAGISQGELAWLIEMSVEAKRQSRKHVRSFLGGVRG